MLEPTYRQLQAMKLERSPFVIISVVGQELLAQGQFTSAVEVLEAALRIGTCSLKLRGSVFSALSSAYWALNTLDKVTLISRSSSGALSLAKSDKSMLLLMSMLINERLITSGCRHQTVTSLKLGCFRLKYLLFTCMETVYLIFSGRNM